MTNFKHRVVEDVASGQLGALSREQAHAIGMTDEQLRSRVQSGFLTKTWPNTFRLVGATSTSAALLTALVIDIGGDVCASGRTAAALHGFDGYRLQEPFDLTIGRGRHVNRIGHRIHTTTQLDPIDRCEVDGVPTMRAGRAIIDLARTEMPAQLVAAMDSGLRDGKFTEGSLHRRIVSLRGSGRAGIGSLLRVIEGREAILGAHSWLEREFLRLLHGAGLPRPDPQRVLTQAGDRLVRVDFHFPGTRVVVEVLGYTWHRDKAHLRRDTERLNALVSAGFRPYQFTYEVIVEQPTAVLTEVAEALALSA
jgi:hypothetical protein